MKKMKNVVSNLKTRVMNRVMLGNAGVKTENGGHLVEVLGTIAIAIFLLIIFRTQLAGVFNTAMSTVGDSVNNLFK